MRKPTVYISSPYTKGDPAINARFQCETWDKLMNDGRVLPIAPLWSHFQHEIFPRHYQDWLDYDLEIIGIYDICLRLDASYPPLDYLIMESSGADDEVAEFEKQGKPVFYCFEDLYAYLDDQNHIKNLGTFYNE